MSDLLLILILLTVLVLTPIALLARRRRPAPSVAPTPRVGLIFQRPVAPLSKVADMQVMMADKPPMFANFPAVIEGELSPERLSPS